MVASKMESNLKNLEPIFIHSSFRTGSTWLWSKFRENNNTYCYYEVFNEILSDIDIETIQMSSSTWNSHHPPGPPYFTEFSPLLRGNGISGFDRDMATADFFLKASGDSYRVAKTRDYLLSIVNLAQSNNRVPVLSCTRSIGRIAMIREIIGGSHILLKRKLFNQWLSYSNQSLNGNHFFFQEMILSILASSDSLLISVKKEFLDNITDFNNPSDQDYDNLLIAFLCLHLYLYTEHGDEFDLVLDFGIEQSCSTLERAAAQIKNLTSLDVDISDYREAISAPQKLVFDIDRVISTVGSLLSARVSAADGECRVVFIENELAMFRKDFLEYKEIAGSAHSHLDIIKNKYIEQQLECEKIRNLLDIANEQNILLNSRLESEARKSDCLSRDLDGVKNAISLERDKLNHAIGEYFKSIDELMESHANVK